MVKIKYKMRARVWVYPGETSVWHMATLPKKESREIRKIFGVLERGWRSLRVLVAVGKTSWKTSIFYDNKLGAYILPLKAEVRKKEEISAGDIVTFLVEILV